MEEMGFRIMRRDFSRKDDKKSEPVL